MDPPVWTTARYPPLHDLTPLLKTLLQFGLHLPLPACPFRTWVATFTPRFSVFTRRQLFKRKKCRPHVPGRKRATPVYSRTGLACFTRTALACFTRRELFKRKKCRPHGPGKERAMPVHTALATTVSRKVGFARRRNSLATTWPRKLENLFFQAPAFLFLKKLDSFWKPLAQALHVALPVHLFTTSLQASCVGLAGLLPAPVGSAS